MNLKLPAISGSVLFCAVDEPPCLRVRMASCWSVCLVIERRANRRGFHTEARRHGAWVLCGGCASASPRLRVRMASCWSLCLVIERRANRSRVSHEGTKARSLGSDVVDVCVLTISINFNPASLLFLSRESTMNHKKATTGISRGFALNYIRQVNGGCHIGWRPLTSCRPCHPCHPCRPCLASQELRCLLQERR